MMVDTATASDRDNFSKNMKRPETERSNNNYDLRTDRTAYEDISEEDDDEDISRLESASVKRKSSPGGGLFSNPLRVETAESSFISSALSGPASAPSAVDWAPSPLSFLSPAPSLSPGFLPHYYHHPPPLPNLPIPSLSIYQSSTPLRAWQHPFSISSLLGDSPCQDSSQLSDSRCQDSGYDSHHLTDSRGQSCDINEDSYIDVVGLDDEEDSIKAKEILSTNDDANTKETLEEESERDRLEVPLTDTIKEESCVFDIKKKMLDNWSKSRKDTTNERDCTDAELSEYQHKKIRKASHEKHSKDSEHNYKDSEPLKPISDDETDEKLKKKSFQIEWYQVNRNINKNKRKEEKWSSSEADSPDKYKDKQKVKKKHKSHKEERWKISKNLKSPIRNIPDMTPSPKSGSCALTESDLVEGLRLLLRVGSHFYAGRLTEISPPDIYGIIIDKERGKKPHIFSRQEIIRDAIVEIRPECVSQLGLGRRICVYWSSQLSYLHPSTVVGPDSDDQYILVQLDDGDSRDVHIDQVRYLPDNYPIVDSALGAASELEFFGGRKGQDYMNDVRKEKTKVRRGKKKEQNNKWSVVVTEVVDEKPQPGLDFSKERREVEERSMEDDQDSAFESDTESSVKGGKKSNVGITSFLPPQHRLWRWGDEGRKLSAKSRRVYHQTIARGETERITVGDCAVFLSTGRPDTPYIGRIHAMWQTATGNMRVQVKWFYHPAEVDSSVLGDRMDGLQIDHPLFSSGHSDENDVQTISHKCLVLQSFNPGQSGQTDSDSDVYQLVGDYDPLIGTVTFLPGVCQ